MVTPYATDPKKLMGSWKTAWNFARKKAAVILADSPEETEDISPLGCRFHDCRHTAVSRMIDAGVPLPKVAKIVGWSSATMVRMAARYGHFSLKELRGAVEAISKSEITAGSLVFSPVSDEQKGDERPN